MNIVDSKPIYFINDDDAEMMLIRMHSTIGSNILRPIDFPWPIAEIVEQHHEKINGTGYGKGLKGDEIQKNKGILYDVEVVNACIHLFSENLFSFD